MSKSTSDIIDLTDSVSDIAANLIHNSEYNQLPSDIFESLVFQVINELVDDFATNPDKYLKPHHQTQIEFIARDYLNS